MPGRPQPHQSHAHQHGPLSRNSRRPSRNTQKAKPSDKHEDSSSSQLGSSQRQISRSKLDKSGHASREISRGQRSLSRSQKSAVDIDTRMPDSLHRSSISSVENTFLTKTLPSLAWSNFSASTVLPFSKDQVDAALSDQSSAEAAIWRLNKWASDVCGFPSVAVKQLWADRDTLQKALRSKKNKDSSYLGARSLGRAFAETWLSSKLRHQSGSTLLEAVGQAEGKHICGLLMYLEMVVAMMPDVSSQHLTCIWESPEPAWAAAETTAEVAADVAGDEYAESLQAEETTQRKELSTWAITRSLKACKLGEEELFEGKMTLLPRDIAHVQAAVDMLNNTASRMECCMVFCPANQFYYCIYQKGHRQTALDILGITEPCGFLAVAILAGFNLVSNRGGININSYAVCRVGRQTGRSKSVENDVNPVWKSNDFQFEMNLRDPERRVLHLEVWDEPLGGSRAKLGAGSVDITQMKVNCKQNAIVYLDNKGGQLELEMELVLKKEYGVPKKTGIQTRQENDKPRRKKPSWGLLGQEMVHDEIIGSFLDTVVSADDATAPARHPQGYQAKLDAYINGHMTSSKPEKTCVGCGNFFLAGSAFCHVCGSVRPGREVQTVSAKQLPQSIAAPASDSVSETRQEIEMSTTVHGVDYFALMANGPLQDSFQHVVKNCIVQATASGVTAEEVQLRLSPGSVVVQASIVPTNQVLVHTVMSSLMTSQKLAVSMLEGIKKLPGIRAIASSEITVANAKFKVVGDGSVQMGFLPVVLDGTTIMEEDGINRWKLTRKNFASKPSASGISFRKTKNLSDRFTDVAATWETSIIGTDEGDGWVHCMIVKGAAAGMVQEAPSDAPQYQECYLPLEVGGTRVLVQDGEQSWRVTAENFREKPNTPGLAYRKSKHMSDVLPIKGANWEIIVNGVDEGDGWCRCKVPIQSSESAAAGTVGSVQALVAASKFKQKAPLLGKPVAALSPSADTQAAEAASSPSSPQKLPQSPGLATPPASPHIPSQAGPAAAAAPTSVSQKTDLSVTISHAKNLNNKGEGQAPKLRVRCEVEGRPESQFATQEIQAADPAWQEEHQLTGFAHGDVLRFMVDDDGSEIASASLVSSMILPAGFDDYLPLTPAGPSLRITVEPKPSQQFATPGTPSPAAGSSSYLSMALSAFAGNNPLGDANKKSDEDSSRRQRFLQQVTALKAVDSPRDSISPKRPPLKVGRRVSSRP